MTPAQMVMRIAGIPRSCTCPWNWTDGEWVRVGLRTGCPWHTMRPA